MIRRLVKNKNKNKTILAIDVGNTAISLGLFRDNKLIFKTAIPTKECEEKFNNELYRLLRHFISRNDKVIAVVASVVPAVNKIIKNNLQKTGIRYRFFSPLDIGISIKCKEPKKVGVDRLLNALAAYKFYKKGAIIVDCGTATTFDVVSEKGEYLGGAIAPGLKISAEALARRCAKLFPVQLTHPKFAIGKDTKSAMLSGIVLGHIAMIEGMAKMLKQELNFKPIIIGTGGFISFIAKGTKIFDAIEPNLTLKGLDIMAEGEQ